MEELYNTLKKQITSNKLKELTLHLIEAHKNHKEALLQTYGETLFPGIKEGGKALFYKLIKFFHPDRLMIIQKELKEAYKNKDHPKLLSYEKLISLEEKIKTNYKRRFEMDYREMYDYGTDDFGYGDYTPSEDLSDEEREWDFISAVVAELMGNQDLDLSPSHLAALDGELNLGEYGIEDTEGLQYCRNITSLNLSGNEISNLYDFAGLDFLKELYLDRNHIHDLSPLKGLTNLEVLDLAENEIEDLIPLLSLESIKFLNISYNPLRKEGEVIKLLKERGVIIIQ